MIHGDKAISLIDEHPKIKAGKIYTIDWCGTFDGVTFYTFKEINLAMERHEFRRLADIPDDKMVAYRLTGNIKYLKEQ